MKKLFMLILSIGACLQQSSAQWTMRSASPSSGITELNVLNRDTLFAASGESMGLLKSVDGGLHWDTLSFTNSASFKVHFPDQNTGFIAGYAAFATGPTCYKTIDCGQTWQPMNYTIGGGDYFYNIRFLNKDTGFISNMGQLARTVDGGNSFVTRQLIPQNHYITNIHFISQTTGFVSLVNQEQGPYRDMIFKTTDCGNSWNPVYNEDAAPQMVFVYNGLKKMQFVNSQLGFAAIDGGPGKILKTTDGGNTWAVLPVPQFSDFGITDIHFLNAQTGYVVYQYKIYKTLDGGQTWTLQATSPADILVIEVEMLDEQNGFASGHGLFKTTNGGAPTGIDAAPARQSGFKVYPNPASGRFFLENEKNIKISAITLLDISGKVRAHFNPGSSRFAMPDIPAGTYFLCIQAAGTRYVEKLQLLK